MGAYFGSKENKKPRLVVVIGNIGSGKTTVVELLSKKFENLSVIQEPVKEWQDLGLLDMFYKDKKKYAFSFQTYAFASRLALYKEVDWSSTSFVLADSHVVVDRYVFAEELKEEKCISEKEMKIYEKQFSNWKKLVPEASEPTFIYLNTTPEQCLKRIQARERSEENTIKLEYLINLHNRLVVLCDKLGGEVMKFDGNQPEDKVVDIIATYITRNTEN